MTEDTTPTDAIKALPVHIRELKTEYARQFADAGHMYTGAEVRVWVHDMADLIDALRASLAPSPAAPDRWVETRLVNTELLMSLGYDWEPYELCRLEMHTPHGSFAIWPDRIGGKRWSIYSTATGHYKLDAYTEATAKAECEMLAESLALSPCHAAGEAIKHPERCTDCEWPPELPCPTCNAPAIAAPPAPSQPAIPTREQLMEAISEGLGGAYVCTRVWHAWHVGTMTERDFVEASETDMVADLADRVLAMMQSPTPEPDNGLLASTFGFPEMPALSVRPAAPQPAATDAPPPTTVNAQMLEALKDVAAQARHPDYDWPLCLSRDVSAAITAADAALSQPAPSHADLIAALEFYASKEHMVLSDPSAWDTVSGEPQNWWCDDAGTATIEDGTIAAKTLAGKLTAEQIKAMDDGEEFPDDDEDEPSPAEGTPSQPAPAQAVPLTPEQTAARWLSDLDLTAMHAAFEAAMRDEQKLPDVLFSRHRDGGYCENFVDWAWIGWKAACAAANRAPQAAPVAWLRSGDGYAPVLVEQSHPPEPLTAHEARVAGWRPLYAAPVAQATPAPSVGADGLPTDLWALVRAYGDCRADVAVNSRDASAAQYLKLAESNLRDALAALASRPVGDGGADTVTLVGVKGGVETVLGTVPMPAKMKARELVREMFGAWEDGDGSDTDLCFAVCEQLIEWMAKQSRAARTAGTADTAAGGV